MTCYGRGLAWYGRGMAWRGRGMVWMALKEYGKAW